MIGFVTYAQNFEDLMLWRALHGVQDGFYIDVGAADPDEDSVTRAFYDHGWHGVNVEPSPEHFATISAARPRDVNLRCLVGHSPGDMELYSIRDTGLSTVKRDFAERHAGDGFPVEVIRLPVRTLSDICREYAPPDIHFLKIDVEGAEADVLLGSDFTTYRPWIILVEATMPNSREENWEAWDPLLTKSNYKFVWFDGLNRFYLAAERAEELGHAFLTPPNVFDYWVRPRGQQEVALLKEVRALQAAVDRQREESAKAFVNLDAEAVAARSEAQASRIEASAARAEAGALRTGEIAARQEVTAARAESDALRTAESAARQEVTAARAEADALRTAESAARHEATAARAEADALRTAESAARHEATATRTEAATLRVALEKAQQETMVVRTEATTLRAALEKAQQETMAARTEVATLRALLELVQQDVTIAQAKVGRLGGVLRGPYSGWQRFGNDLARRQRLRLVAELGQQPTGGKGWARIGVYGFGRFMARSSFRRSAAQLVRAILPGPYRWLYARYAIYRNAAASLAPTNGDLPPVPQSPSSTPPDLAQGDLPPVPDSLSSGPPVLAQPEPNNLSAEEQIMLLRLRARDAAA